MNVAKHYEGEEGVQYFAYQSRGSKSCVAPQVVVDKILPFVADNATVLDFGCADGTIIGALKCGKRLGIEINAPARHAAVANGIECYDSLHNIPDRSVDLIMSHHALEHVTAPLDTLSQLRTKLKPGGTLVLIVPIDDWRRQMTANLNDRDHHLYTWTPLLLGNLLLAANFDITSMSVEPIGWCRHARVLYTWLPEAAYRAAMRLAAIVFKTREIRAICSVKD